jgi:hypothetical protein
MPNLVGETAQDHWVTTSRLDIDFRAGENAKGAIPNAGKLVDFGRVVEDLVADSRIGTSTEGASDGRGDNRIMVAREGKVLDGGGPSSKDVGLARRHSKRGKVRVGLSRDGIRDLGAGAQYETIGIGL